MPRPKFQFPMSPRRRRLSYLVRRAVLLAVLGAGAWALMTADKHGVFGRAAPKDWDKYQDRQFAVSRIVDGDTVQLDCPDGDSKRTVVRLLGVDTPETVKPNTPVQYYGPEASRYAKETALGKLVTVRLDRERTRDQHGRLLAYLMLPDGKNLSLEIVASGHGYADPRFRHPLQRDFRKAQADALKNKRGLWKNVTDADLPEYYQGKLKLPEK